MGGAGAAGGRCAGTGTDTGAGAAGEASSAKGSPGMVMFGSGMGRSGNDSTGIGTTPMRGSRGSSENGSPNGGVPPDTGGAPAGGAPAEVAGGPPRPVRVTSPVKVPAPVSLPVLGNAGADPPVDALLALPSS